MSSPLALAEAALERGDYCQCLSLLEPLAKEIPLQNKQGGEIRMLLVTALMGTGDEKKAIEVCRLITKSQDIELRNQAKQLLSILEAPTLQRPSNWSINLPKLDVTSLSRKSNLVQTKVDLLKKKSPSHPPTGPHLNTYVGLGLGG